MGDETITLMSWRRSIQDATSSFIAFLRAFSSVSSWSSCVPGANIRMITRSAWRERTFSRRIGIRSAQAVVRARLAAMIARVESGQNWLEFVTHQMNNVGTEALCKRKGVR